MKLDTMVEETTRRDVLKIAGTASAMSGFAISAAAKEGKQVRVVEAGLRYEVPSNDAYDVVLPDSRPPFTVDVNKRKLFVLNTAAPSTISRIQEADELLVEQSVGSRSDVTVGPNTGVLKALPTELSSRMRATRAVQLESPVRAPIVTINSNANAPALNVESIGTVELTVGEKTEVRLDPVTAEARTTHVVGEASVEGVPEFMQGLKREQDSVEIEVTPIVEAINHGELRVEQQSPPPK